METTNRTSERADIREYLRPLLRRWWLILGIAIAVAAVTYQHFSGQPPRYTAGTRLMIQPSALNSVFTGQITLSGDPDRVANNQATLIQSNAVARQVAKDLGFQGDPRVLLGAVSVRPMPETDFLQVLATTGDPVLAARIANGFARAFKKVHAKSARQEATAAIAAAQRQMDELDPTSRDYEALKSKIDRLSVLRDLPSANVRQLDPAVPPSASAGADPQRNAIFAFVVALLLASGAAYALESLDRRIRRSDDIEPLYGAPVLAELPHARETTESIAGRLAVPRQLVEGFRSLRMNIQLKAVIGSRFGEGSLRTLLVVSAIPGEGKTTVVRNLATAYCESGLKVAVVDADLRKPSLSSSMVEDLAPGVMEVLTGAATIDEALRHVEVHAEGLATITRLREASAHQPAAPAFAQVPATPLAAEPAVAGRRRLFGGTRAPQSRPPALTAPAAEQAHPNGVHTNGTGNGSHNGNGQGGGRLSLLTSGAGAADPGAVLASQQFRALLGELAARHDIVIIDTSPLLPVSDALPLLSIVDGVVVTSRVGVTTRNAARHVAERIRRVPGADVLGAIANDVKSSESQGNYGYHYGSHYGSHYGTTLSGKHEG